MKKVFKKVLFLPELFLGIIIFVLISISTVPLGVLSIILKIIKL